MAGTAGSACYDTLTATRGNIKRTPAPDSMLLPDGVSANSCTVLLFCKPVQGRSQPQKHAFEKSLHAKPEQALDWHWHSRAKAPKELKRRSVRGLQGIKMIGLQNEVWQFGLVACLPFWLDAARPRQAPLQVKRPGTCCTLATRCRASDVTLNPKAKSVNPKP